MTGRGESHYMWAFPCVARLSRQRTRLRLRPCLGSTALPARDFDDSPDHEQAHDESLLDLGGGQYGTSVAVGLSAIESGRDCFDSESNIVHDAFGSNGTRRTRL